MYIEKIYNTIKILFIGHNKKNYTTKINEITNN